MLAMHAGRMHARRRVKMNIPIVKIHVKPKSIELNTAFALSFWSPTCAWQIFNMKLPCASVTASKTKSVRKALR